MEKTPTIRGEQWTPEDIKDELAQSEPELLKYVQLLPKELWAHHFQKLEKLKQAHGDEGEAAIHELRINYILGVLAAREKAVEECKIDESSLRGLVEGLLQGGAFGDRLRDALISAGNFLGAGKTARVKSMQIEGYDQPIAVKYLLTPTSKTLSVQGEYDMIREVETITEIENAEVRLGAGEYIRVPHPLFYYKNGKLQCYGMSQVNGLNLEELTQKNHLSMSAVTDGLRARFASPESRKQLQEEVDVFMRAVHEVCLHGDIKLANVMVDDQGMLYLIDFGQSVTVRAMSEETRSQFENLQDLERGQMQECVTQLFNHLRQ